MTVHAEVETLFPYARWRSRLPALHEQYAHADPFPHIHLEQFLDAAVIERAIAEFPEMGSGPWVHYKHFNENKQGMTARDAFPPFIGSIVDELNSPAFVAWLSTLTGIPDLLADPGLEGGGMHQSGTGGFLNVHADFTRHHHQTTWRRRVNVIVYLNRGWRPEWGGAIELWDRAMTHAVVRVPPLANHAVIFNTDDSSYHGFADPLRCPRGVTRKSLATYYYTEDVGVSAPARSTNYQARPGDGAGKSALIWADKTLVNLYSRAKSTFGLSDDFASRALGLLDRWKRKP
jgi:hypothetical protein